MKATVTVFGVTDTIEGHYQKAKRINNSDVIPTFSEAKGKKPSHMIINGKRFELESTKVFYKYLWYKYLQENMDLLEYASQFATFSDVFRTATMVNCQADVIRMFVDYGLNYFDSEAKRFESHFTNEQRIKVVNGDLLTHTGRIIAHQVNCKGVMGAGVAKVIKDRFPVVYNEYRNHLKYDNHGKLGDMQPVEVVEGHYICNLYGQLEYGKTGQHTNYNAVEKSFKSLEEFALSVGVNEVAMPYGIGCGLGGGDWDMMLSIMERSFKRVSVILYKL